MRRTFDNTLQTSYGDRIYGFIRLTEVNPEKVHCNNCGYTLSFMYHKKQICPNCLQYVYPTKRDEFKDKLKIKIKERSRTMNKDSLKAYSELINQLWESIGKKK